MKNILTAQDVLHAEFKKTMRGYDTDQVDSFLDEVTETLQQIAQNTVQLEQTIIKDKEKLAEYEKTQELIQSTLLMAQQSAQARVEHARAEAENIIEEARHEAENMEGAILDTKRKYSEELDQIHQIRDEFLHQMRGMLERFTHLLDEADEQDNNYKQSNANYSLDNPVNDDAISANGAEKTDAFDNDDELSAQADDELLATEKQSELGGHIAEDNSDINSAEAGQALYAEND